MTTYYVYQIQRPNHSKDSRKYIGVTCNLKRRFIDHKSSKHAVGKFLRKYPDSEIVVLAKFKTQEKALKLESKLVPEDASERSKLLLLNETGGGGVPPVHYGNKHAKGNVISEAEKKRRSKRMKKVSKARPSDYYLKCAAARKRNVKLGLTKVKYKHYKFVNPQGAIIRVVNLKKFCAENNLNYPSMIDLAKGRKKSHKGFRQAIAAQQLGMNVKG